MEKAIRYITQGSLLSPVLKGELLWTSESKTGARITQTLPKWPALGSSPMSHLSGAQEGSTKTVTPQLASAQQPPATARSSSTQRPGCTHLPPFRGKAWCCSQGGKGGSHCCMGCQLDCPVK